MDGLASSARHGRVHQPLREKGRIAAERLLGALTDDPPPAGVELLPTRLVVRDSTAPPKAQRPAS
jgi:DNA-binding LacI/PurR family transcriptional regulator